MPKSLVASFMLLSRKVNQLTMFLMPGLPGVKIRKSGQNSGKMTAWDMAKGELLPRQSGPGSVAALLKIIKRPSGNTIQAGLEIIMIDLSSAPVNIPVAVSCAEFIGYLFVAAASRHTG